MVKRKEKKKIDTEMANYEKNAKKGQEERDIDQ